MATYDLTSAVPEQIKTGDVLNIPYSGAAKSITLPPGRYKLECWGAQGGDSYGNTAAGGLGGYSAGELTLSAAALLICSAGGQGKTGTSSAVVSGGFNGGGNSGYNGGGSGGGASDIRIGEDSLYARVIVAGAGGGAGYLDADETGGNGGGTSGGDGGDYSTSYPYGADGASQTAGGAGNGYSAYVGGDGSFGIGGNALSTESTYNRSGGGGGGWYGGGAAGYRVNSSYYKRYVGGGGGGSGFVWTGKNAPDGYLLNSEYYLTGASTVDGGTAFTSPDGASETGHSGDGYVRITALEVYPQTPAAPTGFAQTGMDYFSIGLSWDAVRDAAGYNLYRDGTLLLTTQDTSCTDTDVRPNTTYTYTLKAYNDEGEGKAATLTAKTTEGYVIWVPVIRSVTLTPTTVDAGGKFEVVVEAESVLKILEPEVIYSGEIYSGE